MGWLGTHPSGNLPRRPSGNRCARSYYRPPKTRRVACAALTSQTSKKKRRERSLLIARPAAAPAHGRWSHRHANPSQIEAMSSGGEHGSDHERDKKHKKHDIKKDKRRSSRSRASEDGGKAVSKDEAVSATPGAPLMPAPPMPPATPPPVDPVAHLHPLLWTEADVALWLQYIGESGLTSCFDVINGVLLVNLDEEQLTNLGVTNVATRKKLMAAIKEVKERSQKVNIKVPHLAKEDVSVPHPDRT